MIKKSQETPKSVQRRQFLKFSTAATLAAAGSATAAVMTPSIAFAAISGRMNRPAALPAAKGPRCVVVGGGVSGLTIAKYLKKENPKFDVVMVEPNATYMSCFLSNLWLDDLVDLKTLEHSFCDAARAGNYVWLQGKLIDLDRQAKRAFTSEGYIDYHYIVLAPGIDYNYALSASRTRNGGGLRAELSGRLQAAVPSTFRLRPSSRISRAACSC